MAISLFGDSPEDRQLAAINTTPLVDVMLVLLIIFLITVPVVAHTVPVHLPREAVHPAAVTPQTVTIAVDRDGRIYWNGEPLPEAAALAARMAAVAVRDPKPEIQIRGDQEVPYRAVGGVVEACRQAGVAKIGFVTEPPTN